MENSNIIGFEAYISSLCNTYSNLFPHVFITKEELVKFTLNKNGKTIIPASIFKITSSHAGVIMDELKYNLYTGLHNWIEDNDGNTDAYAIFHHGPNSDTELYVMLCDKKDLASMGLRYSSLRYDKLIAQWDKEREYIAKRAYAECEFRVKHKILAKIKDFLNL